MLGPFPLRKVGQYGLSSNPRRTNGQSEPCTDKSAPVSISARSTAAAECEPDRRFAFEHHGYPSGTSIFVRNRKASRERRRVSALRWLPTTKMGANPNLSAALPMQRMSENLYWSHWNSDLRHPPPRSVSRSRPRYVFRYATILPEAGILARQNQGHYLAMESVDSGSYWPWF